MDHTLNLTFSNLEYKTVTNFSVESAKNNLMFLLKFPQNQLLKNEKRTIFDD
jgi:hypothetical protein